MWKMLILSMALMFFCGCFKSPTDPFCVPRVTPTAIATPSTGYISIPAMGPFDNDKGKGKKHYENK